MFFEGKSPQSEKCCGCTACQQICPKNAISWGTDKDGFSFPKVDNDKCIECGLCEKVCPMRYQDNVISKNLPKAYASVNNDCKELLKSSSGGVFSVIADFVISKGGIVYGAAFDSEFHLSHVAVSDKKGLDILRGSKYLQSENGNVYTQIRENLKDGKLVYYVGAGCQVAGLKLFLRKEYSNLVTSDILCHGVPPQSVFASVIEYLKKRYEGNVISYNFRDKSVWGWSCSSSSIIQTKNKLKYIGLDKVQDGYFNAFIKGDNYRESCYTCPYAQTNRCGDITLGDFWGVGKYINIPNIRDGVSALLVNTPKGDEILSHIKARIKLYDASIDDIRVINKTLSQPTPRPANRDFFFNHFKENPLKSILSYSDISLKRRLFYLIKTNKTLSGLYNILNRFR